MLGFRHYGSAQCLIRLPEVIGQTTKDRVRELTAMRADTKSKGDGTKLLQKVCAEADKERIILILIADTPSLESWYSRYGFDTLQHKPVIFMMRKPADKRAIPEPDNGRERKH